MNARCCARCKSPYGCANTACRCHTAAVVAEQAHERRMLDSFAGYVWGDPVRLWTVDGPAMCLAEFEVAA